MRKHSGAREKEKWVPVLRSKGKASGQRQGERASITRTVTAGGHLGGSRWAVGVPAPSQAEKFLRPPATFPAYERPVPWMADSTPRNGPSGSPAPCRGVWRHTAGTGEGGNELHRRV